MDLFLFAVQQLAPVQDLCRANFSQPTNSVLDHPAPDQPTEMPVAEKPLYSPGHRFVRPD